MRKNAKTLSRVLPPWLPVVALVVFLTSGPAAAQQQQTRGGLDASELLYRRRLCSSGACDTEG